MRKTIVLLAVISILFTSCIDYTSKVKLNSDGSGTIEETVLMSGMIIQMMNSFSESFTDSTAEPETFSLLDEEQLKQQASEMGEGVKYISGEEIKIDGKEGYKAIFTFDDISKIKLSDNPDDKMPMDEMSSMETVEEGEEYITFNFTKGNPSVLEINLPEESEVEASDEPEVSVNEGEDTDNDMMAEQAKMFLKDFKILMQIEFEGEIEETNATFAEDNIVTFLQMDFEKLMEIPDKFEELQKNEPESMAELKELMKNIPGFKIEMNKKVFVKFN